MDRLDIEIVPTNRHHLLQYAALDVVSGADVGVCL